MIVFLTSSPSGPLNQPNDARLLDPQNKMIFNLKKYWKPCMKGLIIAADPLNHTGNDEMMHFFEDAFKNSDIPVTGFDMWDSRVNLQSLHDYDVIMLAGGHVPTQNKFFKEINLRERIKSFLGIVIGVSAGSMNCADVVYAQPELEGESHASFQRYLQGLNLTKFNILPHYQMVKDYYLDGKRLFETITYPDSYQTKLYCLNDGSYILIEDEMTTLHGEAYLIENGSISIINTKNSILHLI